MGGNFRPESLATMNRNGWQLSAGFSTGRVKAEVAKKIAEDRYIEFDRKRKTEEAKKADEEDLKELEEFERRILENREKD